MINITLNQAKNLKKVVIVIENTQFKGYDTKIIIAGDIVEVISYERPILKTQDRARVPDKKSRGQPDEQQKIKSRAITTQRARSKLRRTISANVYRWYDQAGEPIKPKFLTLTFKENIKDFNQANYEFTKFIQRLNENVYGRKSNANLKYLVVPEFQKRGAIHYHVIFFNLPYIAAAKLKGIWKQGFIKINAIDEVDNVGAYISKYMGKDNDDERLQAKKCFWGSRGLLEAIENRLLGEEGKREVESLDATLSPFKTFQSAFEHLELGLISYTQYNLKGAKVLY